jgi:hypothetical protein
MNSLSFLSRIRDSVAFSEQAARVTAGREGAVMDHEPPLNKVTGTAPKLHNTPWPALAVLCAALLLAGCGGSSSGTVVTPPATSNPPTGGTSPPGGGGSPPPSQPPSSAPPPGGSPPSNPPPPPSSFSVTLSWQAPTERADGTPLTNLSGFRIFYGTARDDLDTTIDLSNPGLSRYVVENLSAGTWYFAMTAYDQAGLQSSPSPTVEARLN